MTAVRDNLSKISLRLLMLASVLVTCILFLAYIIATRSPTQTFVHGKYGHFCYEVQHAPKSIKYFMYFDTEQDCTNDLRK